MKLLIPIGFLSMNVIDILDIFIITLLGYQLYKLVRGSIASRILLGGLAIYTLYIIVKASGMELIGGILDEFMTAGVIAALILFQQEIRKFLLLIGKTKFFQNPNFFKILWKGEESHDNHEIDAIVDAVAEMSQNSPDPLGALIVFTRKDELDFYAESGDELDALLSKRLLISVFYKNSPLHDGAAIIGKNGRMKAARCILPVSENPQIPAAMGLRHRAAIGLSEVTDAIVLVVSEETGTISLIKEGKFQRDLTPSELKERLIFHLILEQNQSSKTQEEESSDLGDETKSEEEVLDTPKS